MADKDNDERKAALSNVQNVPFVTTHFDTTGLGGFGSDTAQVETLVAYTNTQTHEALASQGLSVQAATEAIDSTRGFDEDAVKDEASRNDALVDVSEPQKAIKEAVKKQQADNAERAAKDAEQAAQAVLEDAEEAEKQAEKNRKAKVTQDNRARKANEEAVKDLDKALADQSEAAEAEAKKRA